MSDGMTLARPGVAGADGVDEAGPVGKVVCVDKVGAYNEVNLQAGFGLLAIVSPQEVRFDEDD